MDNSIELLRRSVSVPDHMTLQKVALDGRVDLLNNFLERYTQGRVGRSQLNVLDKEGFAALHYAARFNRVVITRRLLEAKCNPNVQTAEGFTPLHFAARHLPRSSDFNMEREGASEAKSTSRELIRLLLRADGVRLGSHAIQVGAKDTQGVTPLHMACARGNVPAVQELVAFMKGSSALINMKDHHGDTPFHEACLHGNLTIVKELLKHGAHMFARNTDDEIPLHAACKAGYAKIVKEILLHNRELAKGLSEAQDNRYNAPMHLAAESGHLETVKVLLLFGADARVLNNDQVQPIHIAAGHGYLDICGSLVDYNAASKDCVDSSLQSPLHYAARANQVHIIEFLISKGCNKEVLDDNSVSPLLLAAIWGKADAVKALIKGNCEVNTTDKDGKSAVYWAAQEGHMDVLRILLDHDEGIQLCAVAELYHHNTPLHVAASVGKSQALEFIISRLVQHQQLAPPTDTEDIEIETVDMTESFSKRRRMTMEQLADDRHSQMMRVQRLDFRNDENKTPLHLAAMFGHMDAVRVLVQKYPPSIVEQDVNGNTPLHLAALHGRTEVARFLIQKGADVEARNGRLWTPIHLAANKGFVEIISLLTQAEAPLEAKDKSAKTPLFLACQDGHQDAVTVLMEKGADVTAKHAFTKLNCLDVAVENGHSAVALAIIHSNQWEAALRHSDKQMTPFRRMICKMPVVANAVLERCMRVAQNYTEDKTPLSSKRYTVEFSYEFLDDYRDKKRSATEHSNIDDVSSVASEPHNKGYIAKWGPEVFSRESHPLALMVLYSRTDLLKHPVVSSLLDYKWSKYGRAIFLFNLITYLFYLFFLTVYALLLPHPDHRFCHEFSVAQSVANLPVDGTVCPFDSASANRSDVFNNDPTVPMNSHANAALYLAAVVVLITAVTRMIVEFVQLVKTHFRYFLDVENYIEVVAYTTAVIFVSHFGTNCWCPSNWQWQLGAFAVFLAWINFILFLKRVPLLGIYVLMFNSIFYTFFKFAVIALLFVVAFGLAFYMILYKALDDTTLLVNVSPFRNAGLSFIKTMVMTIGEFEYDSIFGHSNDSSSSLTSFPEAGYILWIIFLIVMPILLSNLLVGLAVDDTKAIQDQAQLNRLTLQINVALQTEELLPVFIRRRFVKQVRVLSPNQSLGRLKKFRQDIWGAEHWDSIDIIKKHTQREVPPIEQVQLQTEQLSRDVKELHNELIEKSRLMEQLPEKNHLMEQLLVKNRLLEQLLEKNSRMEQLLEKNSRMEQLLEKNSRMEQLLVLVAQKHGIQWDQDEEESQEELEEQSHL